MGGYKEKDEAAQPIGKAARSVVIDFLDRVTDATDRKQKILALYEEGYFSASEVASLFVRYSDMRDA